MGDLRPNSEIADQVHWISDKYVNAYILEREEDLILVDSGLNKKAEPILKYSRNELESKKISNILLTHHHLDHTGGLHALKQHFHPRMFSSQLDREVISGERKSPSPNSLLMKPLFRILSPFMMPKRVDGIELTHEGDLVEHLHVHELPGHTLGSLGFQKDKVLFSGDAGVTAEGQVRLGAKFFTESMEQAKNSLRKIATLNMDILLPGHGDPILEDASQRAAEAVERFLD